MDFDWHLLLQNTGFFDLDWGMVTMWLVAGTLLYLAVAKNFEPLLLVPIAFGALLANLPTEGLVNKPAGEIYSPETGVFVEYRMEEGEHVELPRVLSESNMPVACVIRTESGKLVDVPMQASGRLTEAPLEPGDAVIQGQKLATIYEEHPGGLFYYISMGIILEIFPPLIFLGVGALTDFGPLIANPKTLLLGAAAQFGVFATFLGAQILGFSSFEAAAIGIIGGADGPTSIFIANKLAPELLAPIAVAAYSYMSLVPVIQPPVMRGLTTMNERRIRMKSLREVSRLEKLVFALIVTITCILLVPAAAALIGMLMFGNFLRECKVTERLTKSAQNEMINIITILLGTSVGITMTADRFLNLETMKILGLGVIAFIIATASGVLMAKFMNLFTPNNKINPLIGSAGVSAVPMAARVSQVEGQKADSSNFLLMHAMGPNVAGVIGTALVAGYFINMLT